MSTAALVLPGLEGGTWQVRNRADPAANALADRHYPRRARGCGRVGGPNRLLVLVSPCERAVWITSWTKHPDDGLNVHRCTTFRNEGAGLSSELIVAAMELTAELWGPPPTDGWATYIDTAKVRHKRDPGRCFLRAGWWRDETYKPDRRRASLIRLRAYGIGDTTGG